MSVDGETVVLNFRLTRAEGPGAGGVVSHWLALVSMREWGGEVGMKQRYFRQPNGGVSGCSSGCWGVGEGRVTGAIRLINAEGSELQD